jgi:hypothetical protein
VSDCCLRDTWTWDGTDWTQRSPVHSPPARYEPGMAYSASDQRIVLFGGLDSSQFQTLGDTWTWDGTDWTRQSPLHSPVARNGHTMSGAAAGQVVLFGGQSDGGSLVGDTWAGDGTDWTQRPGGSVRVLHRSGSPGASVVIQVWGFAAGEHVKIYFLDSLHGSTRLATIITDGSGGGAAGARIPSNATPGTQHIKGRGVISGQVAKAKFTVT